ncbi:MAG: hypothetical protein ABEJ02_02575 [Candidatus Paceibacteria bacterium]
MLEQIAYEVAPRLQRPQSQSTYQVSYLENLSATALYDSGDPSDSGNSGLTVRPIGETQLHYHEGHGGTAHIKYKDGTKTPLNSYQAAMTDLQMDKAGVPKIKTSDKGTSKGRK